MGEARYYTKMLVPTEHVDEIIALWKEGHAAYEFWQAHRGESPRQFWAAFIPQFPRVWNYLESRVEKAKLGIRGNLELDCNNDLAGVLDFGEEPFPASRENLDNGKTLLEYSAIVWHFADWTILQNYLEATYNAAMVWTSDEYTDSPEEHLTF